MERNRSRNRSLFKLSYQTRPSNCGDLSRPLGRLPRFFVDIYVAAVHRSLLRIIERYVTRSSQSFAKRTCPNNSTVRTLRIRVERSSASSCLVHGRTGRKKRRKTKKEKKKGEQRTFPFLSVAARAIEFHSNTLAAPFRSFPLPIQVTRRTCHSHTHTYTYAHVAKSRAKSRGGEETEREGEREKDTERRHHGTEMSHAESHRRLTLAAAPLRSPPPARARGLDAPVRLGGAWSRVPRELTRAAAREPLRSTVRPPVSRPPTCLLATFLAPDRRSPLLPPCPSHPSRVYEAARRGGQRDVGGADSPGNLRQRREVARSRNCVPR